MFWRLAACFSNRHGFAPVLSGHSDLSCCNLRPPKQPCFAIAHIHAKYFRSASHALIAEFLHLLHKNRANIDLHTLHARNAVFAIDYTGHRNECTTMPPLRRAQ